MAEAQPFDILHSDGSDSVVLCDPTTHDDIAEVFHNERHTVTQTVEQALATARLFAAAPALLSALVALRNEVSGKPRPGYLLTLLGDADRAIAAAQVAA